MSQRVASRPTSVTLLLTTFCHRRRSVPTGIVQTAKREQCPEQLTATQNVVQPQMLPDMFHRLRELPGPAVKPESVACSSYTDLCLSPRLPDVKEDLTATMTHDGGTVPKEVVSGAGSHEGGHPQLLGQMLKVTCCWSHCPVTVSH